MDNNKLTAAQQAQWELVRDKIAQTIYEQNWPGVIPAQWLEKYRSMADAVLTLPGDDGKPLLAVPDSDQTPPIIVVGDARSASLRDIVMRAFGEQGFRRVLPPPEEKLTETYSRRDVPPHNDFSRTTR